MATLLFKLHNVPDDEVDEVRQLLQEGGFDVYETSAGRWHSGVAAIWLADSSQLECARAALTRYQGERARRIRQEYEHAKSNGTTPRVVDRLAANPLQFLSLLIVVGIIVGLMTVPFLGYLNH